MAQYKENEFDVIVIGGGITGAGTARDCSLRGLRTLLIERNDIADGATGRNHGLLHSGARYAVTDQESATECIQENMILKKVANHCVDDTSGFFITLPEDDLGYQKNFVEACTKAGIKAEIIDPKEAIRLEPSVNPDIIGAVRVPDGSVDPFRLCSSNVVDAKLHGAEVLVYGHDGFAGELGHVTMVRGEEGRSCGCGRTGCLEAYCSATGVARTAREILEKSTEPSLLRDLKPEDITSLDVSIAAGKGDKIANEIFEFTGKMLGEACADFAAFSSPEAFIFFGGLVKAGDLIMNPIKKGYDDHVLNIFKGKAQFLISGLDGASAAVLGASAIGWEINAQ